jgi:hypothetical protein
MLLEVEKFESGGMALESIVWVEPLGPLRYGWFGKRSVFEG